MNVYFQQEKCYISVFFTWSRGLQNGFPGTGKDIVRAEASRMVSKVLGQVYKYMEKRPPGWLVFMY
jgi:hypothetical protein